MKFLPFRFLNVLLIFLLLITLLGSPSVLAGIFDVINKNIAAKILKPKLSYKKLTESIKQLHLNNNYLLVSLESSFRLWNLELGVQRQPFKHDGKKISPPIISKDGQFVFYSGSKGLIHIIDFISGKEFLSFNNKELPTFLALAKNDEQLLVGDQYGGITIWNWKEKEVLKKYQCHTKALTKIIIAPNEIEYATVAYDGALVISTFNEGCINKFKENGLLVKDLRFSINSRKTLVYIEGGEIIEWTFGDEKFFKKPIFHTNKTDDEVVLSGFAQYAAILGIDKNIKIIDLKNGEKVLEVQVRDKQVTSMIFESEHNLMIGYEDGLVNVIDINSGIKKVQLAHMTNGWSVIDNRGRFDGSEAGIENIEWTTEGEVIGLTRFSKQYFEPGLLASYLRKNTTFMSNAPIKIADGFSLPPKVEIDLDITKDNLKSLDPFFLVAVLEDRGGGIGEFNVYHNGKILPSSALLKKEDRYIEGTDKHIRAGVFQIHPVSGPNTFKAIAENKQGLQAESEKITKIFKGSAKNPRLHILTVGISKYKDSRLNLDYSMDDGSSIIKWFKTHNELSFNDVNYHTLFNEDATKENIKSKFEELKGIVSSSDVLLIYYAGHGLYTNNEWYLMPFETKILKNSDKYQDIGLSSKDIQQYLVDIKAQRVMVLLDSCFSGGSVASFRNFQNFQRRVSRNLSREVGITILAATRKDQEAAELTDLKHGLFTYVVLAGLEGKADWHPEDKSITAHELVNYSKNRIPFFSKKYLNAAQEPTAFAIGADFTLLKLKSSLQPVKP